MDSSLLILLSQYRYDPLDSLISQGLPDAPVHQRFYCKSRLATDIQGAVRCSIVQQGDLLLAEQHRHGDALDSALLATDQQRSVLHVLKSNAPQQRLAYTPYGYRRNESGLTSLLGFNGERSDPVTGHYLLGNGYRAFNPVLMRFNSPDSWSPFGRGGLNPYAYCQGNPVLRSDPTGHVGILFSKALNVLPPPTQGKFLGYYVGKRAPLPGLKNGGTVTGSAMHVDSRLGTGMYVTSDLPVAEVFLRQAGTDSGAQMFGVHHTGSYTVERYGAGREYAENTVMQIGTTYRIPDTQFDSLTLTELPPTPLNSGPGGGTIPPAMRAGEQSAQPASPVPSAAPRPPERSHNNNHALLGLASVLPSAGAYIGLPRRALAVRRYPQ